jgi:hypothetical protein
MIYVTIKHPLVVVVEVVFVRFCTEHAVIVPILHWIS